jgi:hypothetical protein
VVAGSGGQLLKTAGAALLGLSMTACNGGGDDTGNQQPEYGVADTSDTADTADTGNQADYGVPDTGYQAEYGVPDTGEPQPDPDYGVPDTGMYVDNDGDGYSEAEGDCDDTNADIYPGAPETPGDGVDSNCDGNDDT